MAQADSRLVVFFFLRFTFESLSGSSHLFFFFFFSSRRRHTRCLSDWSSDVCSSDLAHVAQLQIGLAHLGQLPLGDQHLGVGEGARALQRQQQLLVRRGGRRQAAGGEIGRASCRERV